MIWQLVLTFIIGFLSGSIVPLASEGWLVFMLSEYPDLKMVLVGMISLGNTLGGVLTYFMGKWLATHKLEQWLAKRKNARWFDQVKKWGSPALFFSWIPIVGDIMVFSGGILGLPFWPVCVLLALGKTLRYLIISGIWNLW